jgi:adenosylcobinamide-GDP ribazoletransferase
VHGRPSHPAVNALRLCLGTLTALPVRPPRRIDRRVAGAAMTLAPLAAALLAVVAGGCLWVAARFVPAALASTLTIALLALLTRGLHLDGLADTADALGSRKPAAPALEVMRRGDVGPFGVVTLLLTLLVQVLALASVGPDRRVGALAVALVASRTVLPLLCGRRVPAARSEGLGALVAGTVSPVAAGLSVAPLAVLVGVLLASGGSTYPVGVVVGVVVAAGLALLVGAAYGWHCVRRLGGVTGDVLGACVEVTFTVALVSLAFL